jgi:hypothetical protein
MRRNALLVLGALVVLAVGPAAAQLGRVDLLQGLQLGLLRAEFRGNGESSVWARVWVARGGPTEVTVAPGTQFWPVANARGGAGGEAFAQLGRGGFGGGGTGGFGGGGLGGFGGGGLGGGGLGGGGGLWGQGGRQGMASLGSPTIGVGAARYAQTTIPTACTDIGLATPTRRDVMVAARGPDERVAKVAAMYGEIGVPASAVQVAVWAVANNAPYNVVSPYLDQAVKDARRKDPQTDLTPASIMASAARLLERVGVVPTSLRLFGARGLSSQQSTE